jgi:hypothetical protein
MIKFKIRANSWHEWERQQMNKEFRPQNAKETGYLGDLGTDGMLPLK